ncbi:MAG: hypothetical protein EZS28_043632 [Streblomastix strix]|uniref:Uncharacterized protein n=1 Tax=Streblomastix strix TaxID=222440 RepID=A0A5J4TTK8_9EUKA|nr:MAG: hypothetical protein EZS28_043632 [Streblomastix strix]
MQSLPEIRPFVLISQNGQCQCAIPVRYDQTPFRDLGLRSYSSISSAMNFGHVWRNPQSQLFPDYDEFEGNTFRKFVEMEIEEELSETGTLTKIPQHSVMRYHIPVFPLRFGRFFNSSIMFGISPSPIMSECLRYRTLQPFQLRKVISMMAVENDIHPQFRKQNDVLLRLSNDAIEHPIPLNSIQRAVLWKRIMMLPKEFQ